MSALRFGWHHQLLDVPRLWKRELDGRGVRVAVLDTGLGNPDGLDRATFEYLDPDGSALGPMDLDGHGTAVASVIASGWNGALGIAPRAAISSYRVLDNGDEVDNVELALAHIANRKVKHVDIVVCAFVLSKVTKVIEDIVRTLAKRGVIVVAPAGNDASAEHPFPEKVAHAITIAGVDRNMSPLPGARMGLWIDAAAPGAALRVLDPDGVQFNFGDTSGATAIVGGVAAAILSTTRDRASRRQLGMLFDGHLKASASSLAAGHDQVGAGLVNPAGILSLFGKVLQ